MELKIDTLRQKFLGELDRELFPLGFKYVKSKHGYILKQENWYFHFLIDCVKWSTTVHITTQVIAEDLLIKDIFNKICGTNYNRGLSIWGGYSLISEFLEQQLSEEPVIDFFVDSEEDILKTTQQWLGYFKNIGMPFVERMMTDKDFAINLVLGFQKSFFFPDLCRFLPIMCKQANMPTKEIELLCNNLESKLNDLKLAHFSKKDHKRWIEEYGKVKEVVLKGDLP